MTIQKSKILIIGGGAIGLLLALVLQAKQSTDIMIIDTNKKRLDFLSKRQGEILHILMIQKC